MAQKYPGPAATRVTEVERKFHLEDQAGALRLVNELPGLVVGEPETNRLAAVYYDTADLTLLANRITLRRRTGGSDAGWHLKLPAGSERTEVRLPLGRAVNRVPAELVDQVRTVIREVTLAPVARLITERTTWHLLGPAGEPLVELADDRVTATGLGVAEGIAESWRELETELLGGDLALLELVGERLVEAGAQPSRHSSKVGRLLAPRMRAEPALSGVAAAATGAGELPADSAGRVVLEELGRLRDQLHRQDPLARVDAPDAVHQVRVACRAMRSVLRAHRRAFESDRVTHLRTELRWLAAEFGSTRDLEVVRDRLLAVIELEPAELLLGPVAARVRGELDRRHHRAWTSAARQLSEPRYFALLRDLDEFLIDPRPTGPASAPAAAELGRQLQVALKRLDREVAAAGRLPAAPERWLRLHEVRKLAKQVRYLAEGAAGQPLPAAQGLVGQMKRIQQILGEHQDADLTRGYLLELAVKAHQVGEPDFSYGRLHQREQEFSRSAEERFADAWHRFRPAGPRYLRGVS
jgi:CHAD domain-containing protein